MKFDLKLIDIYFRGRYDENFDEIKFKILSEHFRGFIAVVYANNSDEAYKKASILFNNALRINVPPEYIDLFKPRFVIIKIEEILIKK